MNCKKINCVWVACLMVIGVLSPIIGITYVAGVEIPHTLRMIISIIQMIVGTVLIVATVLKFKKIEK